MNRILIMFGIVSLALVACDNSTTSPNDDPLFENVPEGKSLVSLDIQGTAPRGLAKSLADSVVLDVTDVAGVSIGAITLHQAYVALKEIELKNENDDQADSLEMKIDFEGPYVVDLIANTVTPSLDTVVIDVGLYNQIEIDLDKIEGDETDDGQQIITEEHPLFGNSVYVAGSYTGATADGDVTAIPFSMSFDLDEEFELSTIDPTTGVADPSLGFNVDEGIVNPVIIAFRLATWLDFSNPETNDKGFDFSNLVVSQDSSGASFIVLDKDSDDDNKDIRKVIKENIKESADYGEDVDGDGNLDDDEDDDADDDD